MNWKTEVKIWQWSRYPFLFGLVGFLVGGALSNLYKIEPQFILLPTIIILISYIFIYKTLGTYFYKPQILTYHIVALFICLGWYQFSHPLSDSTKNKVDNFLAESNSKVLI